MFYLYFGGFEAAIPADASTINTNCASALFAGLDNVDAQLSTCIRGTPDANKGAVFTIRLALSSLPMQNNIFDYTNVPTAADFQCAKDRVTAGANPSCTIAINPDNDALTVLKEHVPCSNRGNCDHASGDCKCYTGWAGGACNVEADHFTFANNEPGMTLASTAAGYTGSVLVLSTTKSASADFNLLKGTAGGAEVFRVDGRGVFHGTGVGDVQATNSLSLTSTSEGATVTNSVTGNAKYGLKVDMTSNAFTGIATIINTASSSTTVAKALMVSSAGTEVLSIRADGKVLGKDADFSGSVTVKNLHATTESGGVRLAATDGTQSNTQLYTMLAHKGSGLRGARTAQPCVQPCHLPCPSQTLSLCLHSMPFDRALPNRRRIILRRQRALGLHRQRVHCLAMRVQVDAGHERRVNHRL